MKPYDRKPKKAAVTALCLLAGNGILAFLVAAFIIPHDIIMGGTTGIGIVLNRAFPSLDISVFVLILNLLLLVLGLVVLGRKFFFTTIVSSVLYPVLLGIFQRIPGIDRMTDNALLAAVFAGCLMGVALGLVMRVGSSTGGMDVVTLVCHKWFHLPVALFVYLSDILVVGGQALFSGAEEILLGILVLVLESIVLDKAMLAGTTQTQISVVSEHIEEIREALLNDLEAGVTMVMIETGRLHRRDMGLLCVIPPRKQYAATELIQSIDPAAFITVSQIKEVRGQGFTTERRSVSELDR